MLRLAPLAAVACVAVVPRGSEEEELAQTLYRNAAYHRMFAASSALSPGAARENARLALACPDPHLIRVHVHIDDVPPAIAAAVAPDDIPSTVPLLRTRDVLAAALDLDACGHEVDLPALTELVFLVEEAAATNRARQLVHEARSLRRHVHTAAAGAALTATLQPQGPSRLAAVVAAGVVALFGEKLVRGWHRAA